MVKGLGSSMIGTCFRRPVEGDQHHSPGTAETAQHTHDPTDFTNEGVLRQEGVAVEHTHQGKPTHSHRAQVEHCQVDEQQVLQLAQVFHRNYRNDH